jgi:hypothetical protein
MHNKVQQTVLSSAFPIRTHMDLTKVLLILKLQLDYNLDQTILW